jgi:hypothetical protein
VTKTIQLCALCGKREATTREHVPAQSLFPKPRPDNLITVPACTPCNQGSAADDEYLRTFFAMRREPIPSTTLDKVRAAVGRALTRPEFPGLQERFARDVVFDWVPEPEAGSRVLTLQTLLKADMNRVLAVVAKNTRGVYYHVTGRVLVPEINVLVIPDYKVDYLPPERQLQARNFLHTALAGHREAVGEVFSFALRVTDDNPYSFAAALNYYKTFAFLAAAVRPDFTFGEPLVLPAA